VLAYGALQFPHSERIPHVSEAGMRAAGIMEEALRAVRIRHGGGQLDLAIDPNQTGLIGPEDSPLMTTLGQLEGKRTATNPNIAGLIAKLLDDAGVLPGDTVAIGSSGSFPSFLVASLAAASAMKVHPVCILSLGSSSYGATDPEFDLLDLYSVLQQSGVCSGPPAAVSLGGEKDIGEDFTPETREGLIRKIRSHGLPLLYEPDLIRNVSKRAAIYRAAARGRVAAFINSGGGYANLGTSPLALRLKPGLNTRVEVPPREMRGVLFEMAAEGIPVIHLLYMKGLAERYGLPWDPIPLPAVGKGGSAETSHDSRFWFVCAAYFGILLLLALLK
jgi:poly-gamma-glutamate system protein